MNNSEFQERTEHISQLVERVNEIADVDARTTALELLQSVMDLHGAGLSRAVEVLADSGESGRNSLAKLSADPLLCGLMVLYGIHPVPLKERVSRAVEELAPQLRKRSATAELVAVDDVVVRVKATTGGSGCGASADEVKQMVEQAILEAAPEVEILLEGLSSSEAGFVPLSMIQPSLKEEKRYEESTAGH